MDIYEAVKERWKTLPQGTEVTVREIMERFSLENLTQEMKSKASKNISSFLCKQVKIGNARKFSLDNVTNIYTKLDYPIIHKTTIEPKLSPEFKASQSLLLKPNSSKEEFNELKLGRAILAIIDNLKNEITSLKDQHKMICEEMKTIKIAYQTAQQKVIELNQKLSDRKLRSFKLEDLQNVVKP